MKLRCMNCVYAFGSVVYLLPSPIQTMYLQHTVTLGHSNEKGGENVRF